MQIFEPPLSTALDEALRQLTGIPSAERTLAKAQAGVPLDAVDRGWLLIGEAAYQQYVGKPHLQQLKLEQAVALGRREGNVPLHASAMAALAYCLNQTNPQRATQLADEALALSDALPMTNLALRARAYIALHRDGDARTAEQFFERATALCLALNYQRNLSYCYGGLIQALLAQGKFQRTYDTYCEMLRTCAPDKINGWAHDAITCDVMIGIGRMSEAYAALGQLHGHLGTPYVEVFYLEHGFAIWLHNDHVEQAVAAARRVAELCRATSDHVNACGARIMMAMAMLASGDFAAAREWIDDFFAYAEAHALQTDFAAGLLVRARVLHGLGEHAAAHQEIERALALADARGAAHIAARAKLVQAAWLHADGHAAARDAFEDAVQRVGRGGYAMLYEAERALVFPLLAAMSREGTAGTRAVAARALEALARVPPRPLRIRGLGQFEVVQGSRTVPADALDARKAGELLRFLLLQPDHAAHRDAVVEALWPGEATTSALPKLHKASSQLRKALEPELPDKFPSRYLQAGETQIKLMLPPGSEFDLSTTTARLIHADSAYVDVRGELFPQDRYADWAALHREQLRERVVLNRVRHAQHVLEADPARALEVAREALNLDAWNEDAAEVGMRAALVLERRAVALRLYTDLERALKNELNISPKAGLRALAERAMRT